MGLELAKAFVTVQVDGTKVGPGLAQMNQAMNSSIRQAAQGAVGAVQEVASATEKIAEEASMGIAKVVTGIMGSMTASMGLAIRKGFGAAAQGEQNMLAFEVLLGSAEEASKMFEELSTFAVKTPFEMPELIAASRAMVTFGERGDEVIKSLEFLGNAASGANTNFNDLAMIYNQVRGAGKLLRQDFYQLSSRGVISLQELADYYGVTTAAANEMISDGSIGFEDLKNVLKSFSEEGGKYFQMMERQSQTFLGMQSTLSDAINMTYKSIGEAFIGPMTRAYSIVIPVVEGVRDLVIETGTLIPNIMAMTTAVGSLSTAVAGLRVGLKLLGVSMRSVLIGTGIGIALVALGTVVGVLVTWFQKLSESIAGNAEYQDELAGVTESLAAAWLVLKDTVMFVIQGIQATLQPLVDYIKNVLGIETMDGLNEKAESTFVSMAEYVGNAVLEITSWLSALIQNWKLIWDNMGLIMKTAFSVILDISGNLGEVIHQSIGYGLNRAFVFIVDFIGNVLSAFWELLKGIGSMIMKLPEMISALMAGNDISEMMGQVLKGPLNNIKALFKGISGEAPDFSKIFDVTPRSQRYLDELKKTMSSVADDQRKIKQDALDKIKAEREAKGGMALEGGGEKKEEKVKVGTSLDAGRYGLADIGTKFQDMLLKGEDKQDQMIGLMEQGNKTQDELLNIEKNREAGAKAVQEDNNMNANAPKQDKMVQLLDEGNTTSKQLLQTMKDLQVRGGFLT